MNICCCKKEMAEEIKTYCQREIESKEQMITAIVPDKSGKGFIKIEQAGIDTLERVKNKIDSLTK